VALKFQNPKRSQFDPTELEARLAAMEERIKQLEDDKLGPTKWGGIA
jgi:hypothetical protein